MITLREQPGAAVPVLRFLVGEKRVRATRVAVFADETSQAVVAHKDSLTQKETVWHVLGFGKTASKAKAMAEATVGADFFMPKCNARFGEGNQVAA